MKRPHLANHNNTGLAALHHPFQWTAARKSMNLLLPKQNNGPKGHQSIDNHSGIQ